MCYIIVSCYSYRSSLVLNPHQDPMLNGFVLPSLLVKNHRFRWLNTHHFSCKTRSCRRQSQPPAILSPVARSLLTRPCPRYPTDPAVGPMVGGLRGSCPGKKKRIKNIYI